MVREIDAFTHFGYGTLCISELLNEFFFTFILINLFFNRIIILNDILWAVIVIGAKKNRRFFVTTITLFKFKLYPRKQTLQIKVLPISVFERVE